MRDWATKVMYKHALHTFKKLPSTMRRKLDKAAWESEAEVAAAAVNMGRELQVLMPVSDERIQDGFLKKYILGDIKIEMEIQAAVNEKSSSFTVRDLPSLAAIMDEHINTRPIAQTSQLEIQQVQATAFQLVQKQLEYDCQAFRAWMSKCRDAKSAIFTRSRCGDRTPTRTATKLRKASYKIAAGLWTTRRLRSC